MITYKEKKDSGFTLIELLVVIAIIGILSSIVLAALGTSRAKARDAKRVAELRQFTTALELYKLDNNGTYPGTTGGCQSGCLLTNTTLVSAMQRYMKTLPVDPVNTNGYQYYYHTTGADAGIIFRLEASRDPVTPTNGFRMKKSTSTYNFAGLTGTPSTYLSYVTSYNSGIGSTIAW